MNLFRAIQPEEDEPQGSAPRPLADRMRPRTLDEVMGQESLLAPGKPLRIQIEHDEIVSMLLWGPPGCGKTTLARLIAKSTRSEFVPFSAVMSGIKEIKQVMNGAEGARRLCALLRGERVSPLRQQLALEVVRRSSTAAFRMAGRGARRPARARAGAAAAPAAARPSFALPGAAFWRSSFAAAGHRFYRAQRPGVIMC